MPELKQYKLLAGSHHHRDEHGNDINYEKGAIFTTDKDMVALQGHDRWEEVGVVKEETVEELKEKLAQIEQQIEAKEEAEAEAELTESEEDETDDYA